MRIPSRFEIKTLMQDTHDPCVSLFLPIERVGPSVRQNALRLRNLLRDLTRQLERYPRFSSRKAELLAPLLTLPDDEEFWIGEGQGLALFRNLEQIRCYQLPDRVKEQVIIASHFYLKPLLPLLGSDGRFYLLALSQNAVRLLEGTRYAIEEVLLPEQIPESLADALGGARLEKELQYHSSTSGALVGKRGRHALVFHGKGAGDNAREQLVRYFHLIDRGLHEFLHDETAPLVLAGVEYLLAHYRQVNTYPHLLERGLTGNPDTLSARTLHEQAWPLVEPAIQQAQQDALAQYQEIAETGQASSNLSHIVLAAAEGRVATLFAARDQEQWGSFDPLTRTLEVHEAAQPGDDDLVEQAEVQTILHGGAVYILERALVPGGPVATAVFRY
jgi:hypothetical protein